MGHVGASQTLTRQTGTAFPSVEESHDTPPASSPNRHGTPSPPLHHRVDQLDVFDVDVVVRGDDREERHSQSESSNETKNTPAVNVAQAGHASMEAHSFTINVGDQQARVEIIKDDTIKQAVREALVAKVTWKVDQERLLADLTQRHEEKLQRVEWEVEVTKTRGQKALQAAEETDLKTRQSLTAHLAKLQTKRRKRHKNSLKNRLDREEKKHEKIVIELFRKHRQERLETEDRLATVIRQHEEKKEQLMKGIAVQEEQAITFVMQVEEPCQTSPLTRQPVDMERLPDVIQRLFSESDVRLRGFDCGLRFLLEAPVSRLGKVRRRQPDIQNALSELMPEEMRADVKWMKMRCSQGSQDTDLRLGQPVPEIHSAERIQTFDPLTAAPRREFTVVTSLRKRGWLKRKRTTYDKKKEEIRSLLVTDMGLIVMADCANNKVKFVNECSLNVLRAVSVEGGPYCLALCHDGLVIATCDWGMTLIVTRDSAPCPVKYVHTEKQYYGIACGGSDSSLVVSGRDDKESLIIHVISREGSLLRQIQEGDPVPQTKPLDSIFVFKGTVLVSDYTNMCVWQFDLATGEMTGKHADILYKPQQVTMDRAGNMYVATQYGIDVMGANGKWRRRLVHRESGMKRSMSVAVSDSKIIVGWDGRKFKVIGYDMCHAVEVP